MKLPLAVPVGILFFFFANVFYIPKGVYKDSLPILVPPKGIIHFTLGYQDVVADSLWIRLIQDFTYCGEGVKRSVSKQASNDGPSLEEKVRNQGMDFFDALDEEEKEKVGCEKGWAYQMLDRITDLSPKFRIGYRIGGPILSVLVGDKAGAAAILEKGLKQYPDDWVIPYRAAYHYLYEMRDLKRAGDLMYLASKNGAPIWASNLAAKLYTRSGQLMLGRIVALELMQSSKDKPMLFERAKKQLEKIDQLLAEEAKRQKSQQAPKSGDQ